MDANEELSRPLQEAPSSTGGDSLPAAKKLKNVLPAFVSAYGQIFVGVMLGLLLSALLYVHGGHGIVQGCDCPCDGLIASKPLLPSPSSGLFSRAPGRQAPTCDSWLHKTTVATGKEVKDPWRYSKAIPRPSNCLVDGIVVEELDVENNFRRGYSLGFVADKEDKTHILPYLRGFQDLSLARASRRVYLDLGGNMFKTSVTWFLQYYPLDFTEIHVFEKTRLFRIPRAPTRKMEEGFVFRKMTNDSRWRAEGAGPAPFPSWKIKRIHRYQQFVSNKDDIEENITDINHFIKKTLKLKPKDTLIVKMDIEEEEWKVLPEWVKDKEMAAIVDELFVEIHYKDETMAKFLWTKFKHSKAQAINLLTNLRRAGYVAHAWP